MGDSQRTYPAALESFVDMTLLLLVGIAGVVDGLRIILTKTDAVGNVSAGGWIVLLGSLLIAGTCGHALKERRAWNTDTPDVDSELKQPVTALGMLLVYIALMEPIGYTLSTMLFMAIYLRVFGKYGVLMVGTISIVFALGSSWLWMTMDMMLPQGILAWP